MKIPLTQGYTMQVDPEDYEDLIRWDWCVYQDKCGNVYAHRRLSAVEVSATGRTHISAHRQIMNLPPGVDVDHRDGNTLDNRRRNLRSATRQQNCWNRKMIPCCMSGYKGVQEKARKDGVKYVARIQGVDRRKHIGTYNTALEAALAYDTAAKELFGEFARLNIIDTKGGSE